MIIMTEPLDSDLAEHIPRPTQCVNYSAFNPDPELGLTPDKSPTTVLTKKCVRFKSPSNSKAKRKVNMNVDDKENNFATTDCTKSKDLGNIEIPSEKIKSKDKHSTKKKSKSKKNWEPIGPETQVVRENHLDIPELNTTLHLGSDILKLQSTNIDIVEAVKHRLTVSEQDRQQVKQKTYTKLNEPKNEVGLFGEAVSVDVPASLVIEQTEKNLNKVVKPVAPRQKPDIEKPTLMKFFKPELAFHRCISHDQHGYQPVCLQIRQPKVDQKAFEQHRRSTMARFSKN